MKPVFPIMYWYGPPRMDAAAVKRIAAAGFTRVPVEGKDLEDNLRIIRLCAEAGLETIVTDSRITRALAAGNPGEREALLREAVADYAGEDNLKAYYLTDEPSRELFPVLGETRRILERLDPGREAYVNLFPNYANDAQLGTKGYQEHLDLYMDEVKPGIISYDHYHFTGRERGQEAADRPVGERERLIIEAAWNTTQRGGFFDNIEMVRRKSRETGVPFMVIILVGEHGPYRNLSEAEIRWEVFQSLAYGSARISYFTYGTPPWDETWGWMNGMVNEDGTPARHYYDVARINRDLSRVGARLLEAGGGSREVVHLGEESDRLVRYAELPLGDLRGLKTTCGLTVGRFDGGLYLLANKSYTQVNKVDLTIPPGGEVWTLDKTTGEWYRLNPTRRGGDTFTLTLMPGDGEVVRI